MAHRDKYGVVWYDWQDYREFYAGSRYAFNLPADLYRRIRLAARQADVGVDQYVTDTMYKAVHHDGC